MFGWFAQRLLQALAVLLAMSIIVFIGVYAIGNPVDILIAPDAGIREREAVTRAFGLDRPLWEQYLLFLQNIVRGDFSNSFVFGQPALQLILQRMPATIELAALAVLISLVVGIPLGVYAGLKPNSVASKTIMTGSILGFSLPTFWVGLMLMMLFAVQLRWLPSSGRGDTVEILGMGFSIFTLDGLRHLALPAITLSLSSIALVLRLSMSGVRETMSSDYIKFARAKGLKPQRIVGVHVLKSILVPIITVVGLDFGTTVAFAIVIENIFAWPGMGKLIIDSIASLDRPVIVAYLMIVVVMFVTINLLVDVAYTLIDPRIKQQGRSS